MIRRPPRSTSTDQPLHDKTLVRSEDAADNVATLRIHLEKWGSTPISIDQFGRAQEYTLRYAVVFSLDKADGSNVVPEQTVERSEEHTSELPSLMRISYAVFCLKNKNKLIQ